LIKQVLYIAFLLIAALSFGQDDSEKKETTWKQERKKLKYKKEEGYKGPDNWYGKRPTSMKDEELSGYGSGSGSYGSYGSGSSRSHRYNPQQIQRDRQKRHGGFDRGGGSGNLKYDPKVKRPEPIKSPKTTRVQPSQFKAPDASAPAVSTSFWKVLLYILLLVAVMIIVHLIVKRYRPPNKSIPVNVENEWNPEVITKTELELKLEAAMAGEDYRECVRIYFTFILKELISKGWIRWKKEKTNHHYVMEMGRRSNALSFMECVRIYDLVWYGNYHIDQDIFEMLKPTLENYYKSLDPKDE